MLGAPIDAWYVWLGTALATLAVLGVATSAAPSPPSDAERVAQHVDAVAASDAPASARYPIDADRLRVDGHRVALVGETERVATLRRGPVTPAPRDTRLRAVALGRGPSVVFDSPAQLRAAAEAARADERTISPAGDELIVRAVHWDDVSVTLVTA